MLVTKHRHEYSQYLVTCDCERRDSQRQSRLFACGNGDIEYCHEILGENDRIGCAEPRGHINNYVFNEDYRDERKQHRCDSIGYGNKEFGPGVCLLQVNNLGTRPVREHAS